MTFKDITGVFSRYFIAGFFLPAFFGILAASLVVARHFNPIVHGEARTVRLLTLLLCALLVGLVLLVLRIPVIRLFEGYALEYLAGARRAGTSSRGPSRWDAVPPVLRPTQLVHAAYSALLRSEEQRRSVLMSAAKKDDEARRQADRSFVRPGVKLLPTRLGNVVRAFEYHGDTRWGLSGLGAWPRIAALVSERERDLHVDAETDLAFCLNSCVATWLLAGGGIAYAAAHPGSARGWALAAVSPILAYALYRLAIGAATRWGVEVRASIDLNRLEMYRRLGLMTPISFSHEREMAETLSRFLDFGGDERLPDYYWGASAGSA